MKNIEAVLEKIVKNIMTVNPIFVSEEKCIEEAALILTEKGLNALPVCNEKKEIQGIITLGDLLLKATRTPLFDMWNRGIYENTEDLLKEYKKIVGTHIRDVMSHEPYTVSEDATLSKAATIMYRKKVKQLPVVDGHNVLVGIITATDIVRILFGFEQDLP